MIVKAPRAGLMEQAMALTGGKGPAPVHLWNPDFCGDSEMRIARDGTWFHQGTPIGRAPLVRLFSTILKREGDAYFLVTPVEKLSIAVEDVPFVAVDLEQDDQGISFITGQGDLARLGADHPLRLKWDTPYVMVRAGLEARVDRKTFFRLVEMGKVERFEGEDWFGVRSDGVFFPLMRAKDMG
ncbi:DUF1285 domain-containing protein [Neogemmobacter tilapiae]|nr:DUF1285 domain-containing protein [Gemmobacter tilapiae]